MGTLFRKIMQPSWDVSLENLADCAKIGAKTKTRIEEIGGTTADNASHF
jgi:hypothetical protein